MSVGDALDAAARQAQDMLLVYYAGHGLLDRNNDLFLSIPSSRRDRVRLSAVPYNDIREVMLDSPAANRIVILDCCFSGRAIGQAMADVVSVISGQVDISGTYTLTSTSANATALALKGAKWTAFTGELIRMLREGVAVSSELLTLDLLYRHLHQSMSSQGLPRPEQRGTRTAGLFALSPNPRRYGEDENVVDIHDSPTVTPISSASAESTSEFPSVDRLFSLLGVGPSAKFDLSHAWRPRPVYERFRVAFGVDRSAAPVELDIKETTSGGMGPNGLCIGAPGSGKRELLRTIVLGLIATHSPATLNFMLVDFERGVDETFKGFEAAPHVSANISNLDQNPALIDRVTDVLAGEMHHRQGVLDKAKAKNVWDYNKMVDNDRLGEPLPALVVVIDGFDEVLSQKPDFAELLVMICRISRSLQIHLLLASQRFEEDNLRGLDSHLSYRIALKTFDAVDTRAAIGIPDAAFLPVGGGHGYLKHPDGIERFYAAPSFKQLTSGEFAGFSEAEAALQRMRNQGAPAHQLWLPPLDTPPTLNALLQTPLQVTDDRGYAAAGDVGDGRLQIPVGLIDVPYYHRQDPLMLDLGGPGGHGAIVGASQSGRSNLMLTLICAMALTHTPQEAQFYIVDLGGGSLAALRNLPHIGAYSTRQHGDTVHSTFTKLKTLMASREARFTELGIDSMTDFRSRKRRGELTEDPYGDVFLMIDGWETFREEFEPHEGEVLELAQKGLTFGIHVFLSSNRWAAIRPALKDLLGTRLELRLGDPSESEIDRKIAANVPKGRPGRGLHWSKHYFLSAVPRVDSDNLHDRQGWESYNDDLTTSVADLVNRIRSAWQGPPAPQVRLLPDMLPYELMPTVEQQPHPKLVPIGINEDSLQPVYLDFRADPHFYAFAERETGKTSLLRTIVQGITIRYTPQEALILLVDFRRTMEGFLDTEHLLVHSASADQLEDNMRDVVAALKKRLPQSDLTPEQYRTRWSGPDLFIVIDDYELVTPRGSNLIQPLARFIPQAQDIGLHFVLARNSAGASRALDEPIISTLRQVATPGLIMSANPDDDQLIGSIPSRSLPPGRGTLVRRRLRAGPQLIQIAYIKPN